jgi:hypothetical protein
VYIAPRKVATHTKTHGESRGDTVTSGTSCIADMKVTLETEKNRKTHFNLARKSSDAEKE